MLNGAWLPHPRLELETDLTAARGPVTIPPPCPIARRGGGGGGRGGSIPRLSRLDRRRVLHMPGSQETAHWLQRRTPVAECQYIVALPDLQHHILWGILRLSVRTPVRR